MVVASGAGGEFLFRCLASLCDQAERAGAEILVVDRVGEAARRRIAAESPGVRVLAAPDDHRATVPEMRRIGVESTRGSIVAVLEEHCTAPPHWIDTIAESFRPDDAAIGGADPRQLVRPAARLVRLLQRVPQLHAALAGR